MDWNVILTWLRCIVNLIIKLIIVIKCEICEKALSTFESRVDCSRPNFLQEFTPTDFSEVDGYGSTRVVNGDLYFTILGYHQFH